MKDVLVIILKSGQRVVVTMPFETAVSLAQTIKFRIANGDIDLVSYGNTTCELNVCPQDVAVAFAAKTEKYVRVTASGLVYSEG